MFREIHRSIACTMRIFGLTLALVVACSAAAAASYDYASDHDEKALQGVYDYRFMVGMIDHHYRAVLMGQMCLDTELIHPELTEMCEGIVESQQAQIDQMQQWLMGWYGATYEPQLNRGRMKQMEKMDQLSGAEFEIAFMKSMLRHHWLAVVEGSKCIEFADHEELREMCKNIVLVQTEEIRQMREWLCEWYGFCNYGPQGGLLKTEF